MKAPLLLLALAGFARGQNGSREPEFRLITLDPGHFHAALVQKEMYPGVSKRVAVYGPLGPDLIAHLNRIAAFNLRKDDPTAWELDVHAVPDCLEQMLRDRPGNIVVFSGKNSHKIDRVKASVEAGLNVLVDKPWIIHSEDMPKLESALDTAERKHLVAYDIMTERYEITSVLLRELLADREVFGEAVAGTDEEPGVFQESVHHIFKAVAGVPLLRPAWFFDTGEQGEGVSDVGTHLVDAALCTLFPGQAVDYRRDVKIGATQRWPTILTREQFSRVTGEPDFPESLARFVKENALHYYCNSLARFTVRGIHVKLNIVWRYEAPAGTGDVYNAFFRGSRARLEVRQGKAENYRPELFVTSTDPGQRNSVMAALKTRVESLQREYPGVALEEHGASMRVTIPDKYRVGHEAHFAQVTRQYLAYLRNPASVPAWEKADMLAKYYITTKCADSAETLAGPPTR